MELQDYLRAVRSHWLGFLLVTGLTVLVAAGYTATQPKVYAADASGFVTTGGSADGALNSVNDSLAKSRAASYVDLASSRAVAQLVIDDLGLDESPASLIGNISVQQPADTVLIKITARSGSPLEAQQLADAWVTALAEQVAQIEDPTTTGGNGNGNGDKQPGQPAPNTSGVLSVKPIESAVLPGGPVSPNPRRNLAIALLLGLILATGYAVVRSRLDRRLRLPEEVEREFGVPIVGRLPLNKEVVPGSRLVVHGADERHGWGTGEAFRKLRSNLAYMNVDDPPRIVVVTSPRPRDGKSTTAANLAAAVALSGQSVVLVDGDLRRPTVAQTLGLVEGAGLTDVLIGKVELDDVLQNHVELDKLSVLAAGSLPPNPSELLGSQSMLNLLKELSVRGIVIIDAPPILPVTDGAVLTRHSDGAIVVVSHGGTLDVELGETLAQLSSVQGKVLGVVFNRMPRRSTGAKYGYYSSTIAQRESQPRRRPWRRAPRPAQPGGGRRAAR